MKMSLLQGGWEFSPDELKHKGLVGEVMWDIIWCDSHNCRSRESFLELVEETAKEIVEKVVNE